MEQIVSNADSIKLLATGKLDSGVSTVPVLNRDATDRNRTTPFAFTGNKFEFRMVGSSDSIADANTTLNAIVAEALCQAADELEAADDFSTACMQVIHRNMTEHQRIIFNGDGYSEEWVQEAARRGLPNLPSLVDAVPALTTQKAINLFTRFGIYTPQELEARAEIMYETYIKVIKIEANTMIHMAAKHYIPAVIHYTTRLAQSINAVASACPQAELSVQRKLLQEVSRYLADASTALEQLKPLMGRVDSIDGVKGDGSGLPRRGGTRHGRPALPHRHSGADGGQIHLACPHLRRSDVRGLKGYNKIARQPAGNFLWAFFLSILFLVSFILFRHSLGWEVIHVGRQ